MDREVCGCIQTYKKEDVDEYYITDLRKAAARAKAIKKQNY